MVDFITINGVDYSSSLLTSEFEKSNVFFTGQFDVNIFDEDGTISDTIERYMQAELYEDDNATKKFTGVITDILASNNDSSFLNIVGLDYWTFALREPLTRTFTNQSASQILTSIINTELAGLNLTTTGIVATTTIIFNDATETKMIYRGNQPISEILLDLALREDFIVNIDETKDVIFRSNIAVDSGVHLIYADGDILDEKIQKFGGDIVNVVNVRGAPGQPPDTDPVGAIVEDMALIAKYATSDFDGRLPIVTITRTELATVEACREAGEFEIKKRNQDPDRGPILVELNFNVDVNELVTLTIPHANITAQTFMVQNIKHSITQNITELDVVYFTRETADLVALIMAQNRGTELYLVDDALVFTKFVTLREEITLTAFVDVDSRSFAGAEYGEFTYSSKFYGQTSGALTSEVSNKQITVQNKLFENWLRIMGQIATVPNVLDGNNSHLAIGDDSTAIQVTDTTLASENFRKGMEAGFPNRATDLKLIFKSLIDDVDAETATFRNLALFDASASGNMLLAGVLDSNLSKSADQEWVFTVTLVQASGTGFLTTAGANLLRDILSVASTLFLDNSNAAIEIITSPVDRTGMDSGFPKFTTIGKDQLKYEVTIDTVTLDGKTFSGMDLYNLTIGGTQVMDGALAITTTITNTQNMKAQILIKFKR